jgi:NTE family protein
MGHDGPVADEPIRVALVLGAGGSVGHAFHVGVLSALADELGWDARSAALLVGTSAGSIVAASLRAGLAPADMRARALGWPLSESGQHVIGQAEEALARARVLPPANEGGGRRLRMASPERVVRALREPWRVTPGSLFSAMIPTGRIPTEHLGAPYDAWFGTDWPHQSLEIVAVRLDLGTRVVFGGRDRARYPDTTVGEAVQASCAVPGFFAPVVIDGERFVDGGVHSTTNADLAARLPDETAGAPDLVVISAPMSPERVGPELAPRRAVRQFARRALATEVAGLRGQGIPVVAFTPDRDAAELMAGSSMDATKAPSIVDHVNAATRVRLGDPDLAGRLGALRS